MSLTKAEIAERLFEEVGLNKREAKEMACTHAALVVESALAAGWDIESWFTNDADVDRFEDALGEVIDELTRRGKGRVVAPDDVDLSH